MNEESAQGKSEDRGSDLGRLGRWRSKVMALILLAYLALAITVSLCNPLFESTDEIRHYRFVRHLVTRHQLPIQGEEEVRSQSHHPPLYYVLSALASGWVSSPHSPEYDQPRNPYWGYRNWEVGVDNKLQYHHSSSESFPFRGGFLAALIPRWVNVILGAVTVWLTYLLGMRVWREPAMAWAAAALVAFNPQFIYLSGAMNNDIVAAATGTAVLLLSVTIAQEGWGRRRLLLLGLAYGLALLAKFHLVALGGIIALALAWGLRVRSCAGRDRAGKMPPGWRGQILRWLGAMGVVLVVAMLLAGWWFVRNWWLYGDFTGLNKVNELWAGRPASGNWWALQQGLPYLWSSLWGRFGYGQIPLPGLLYQGMLVLCLLGLLGYLWPSRRALPVESLALLGAMVVGFVVIVIYYIMIQPAGPMGRFLFPALPAFTVILTGGLVRWPVLQDHARQVMSLVSVGMAAFALVALFGFLMPAVSYPPSAAVSEDAIARAEFGDVARVLSVGIEPEALKPGEPIFVTVRWQPLLRTDVPYSVFVHLIDEDGVLVAQRDTWPGLGRAPTTDWRIDRSFTDTYRVDLPASAYAPNLLTARVGLFEPSLGRLPASGPDQEPIGDAVVAGSITLDPRPGAWPNPQNDNFGDEIDLVGYALEPRSLAAGETFTLTLYWQPRADALRFDYLVFAQVVDAQWSVWGSRDGAGPGWSSGQVVEDVRRITLLPDTPPGSYPIQVGLFHDETGRLPVIAPGGHYIDERVLLGPVRVRE